MIKPVLGSVIAQYILSLWLPFYLAMTLSPVMRWALC